MKSYWVMGFGPEITRKEFELEEDIIPVCILVMDYPAEDAADEIVTLL